MTANTLSETGDIVEQIVRALVDDRDQVEVSEVTSHRARIIEVSVAADDVGKVIGREGQTANAIRKIVQAASGKENLRTTLHILDHNRNEAD